MTHSRRDMMTRHASKYRSPPPPPLPTHNALASFSRRRYHHGYCFIFVTPRLIVLVRCSPAAPCRRVIVMLRADGTACARTYRQYFIDLAWLLLMIDADID